MAEFRAILESLGFDDVRTLLNSGNAVASAQAGSTRIHAERIHDALAKRLSVDVPVIVKIAKEMSAIQKENDLANTGVDPSRLLVAFAPGAKILAELKHIAAIVVRPERFLLGKHAAYLSCPQGILESKAAVALLGKRAVAITTRNWATVLKLVNLVNEAEPRI